MNSTIPFNRFKNLRLIFRDFERFTLKEASIIIPELSNFCKSPAKPGIYLEEIIGSLRGVSILLSSGSLTITVRKEKKVPF
jgi:hypothetical protein